MFEGLKSVLHRLRGPSDAERERSYLSAAVSAYDLERRQREIDLARAGKATWPF